MQRRKREGEGKASFSFTATSLKRATTYMETIATMRMSGCILKVSRNKIFLRYFLL